MTLPARLHVGLTVAVLMTASAQSPQTDNTADPAGWINGKPIPAQQFVITRNHDDDFIFLKYHRAPTPADEPEIAAKRQRFTCMIWENLFNKTVLDDAIARFAITVTDDELRAIRLRFPKFQDPVAESALLREKGMRLRTALEDVHLRKKDPQLVYNESLTAHGFGQQEWDLFVFQGREEPRRSKLSRWMIEMTPQAYTATIARSDLGADLRMQRLHARVIAEAKAEGKLASSATRTDEYRYFETWKSAQIRTLKVTLADPAVAKRCAFSTLGIQVPGAPQ